MNSVRYHPHPTLFPTRMAAYSSVTVSVIGGNSLFERVPPVQVGHMTNDKVMMEGHDENAVFKLPRLNYAMYFGQKSAKNNGEIFKCFWFNNFAFQDVICGWFRLKQKQACGILKPLRFVVQSRSSLLFFQNNVLSISSYISERENVVNVCLYNSE